MDNRWRFVYCGMTELWGHVRKAEAGNGKPGASGQYRNLHLLSIGYDYRPRLRPRLTQSRSALLLKPWIFGHKDSHLILSTHSVILSSMQSTAPFGTASSRMQCSSTNLSVLSFGGAFQPRTFSAQDLSTSELLRTL